VGPDEVACKTAGSWFIGGELPVLWLVASVSHECFAVSDAAINLQTRACARPTISANLGYCQYTL
jgi:hypothetical protein